MKYITANNFHKLIWDGTFMALCLRTTLEDHERRQSRLQHNKIYRRTKV